ncbi:MAG: glycosyltransferase family 9 protein [Acidiferrobacter sp.]
MTDTPQRTHNDPSPLRGCKGRIDVFRALNLGDMLCAIPVLRALRATSPDARIPVIGLPWGRELMTRHRHYVDDFLLFPGHPQWPETHVGRADYGNFRKALPGDFDWLIPLHGDGRLTAAVASEWPAIRLAGSVRAGVRDSGSFFPYPSGHEIDRLLGLIRGLDGDGTSNLELPLHQADFAKLWAVPEFECLRDAPYVVVHPGSRDAQRRLAPMFFEEAVGLLAAHTRVVLTGSAQEWDVNARIAEFCPGVVNAAGATSLGMLGALIAGARCLVTHDTGPSYLAAAFHTPSLVVVTGSDPGCWAPKEWWCHRMLDARRGLSRERFLAAVSGLWEHAGRVAC